jgi:arylsulfatase
MSKKPNILIINTDQMRADAMGAASNSYIMTPNIDRLAERGMLFNRAYCGVPTCTPSRTALFTGRYPHATGTWQVGHELGDEEITLCDYLKPLGYKNIALGKMHLRPQRTPAFPQFGAAEDPAYRDRPRTSDGTYFGFDEHHTTEDNKVGEYLDWIAEVAPEYLKPSDYDPDQKTVQRDGSNLPVEYHQTRWVGDLTVNAIEEHDFSQPLFVWTSFVDPHHPFDAPKHYVDMYKDREVPLPVKREGEHENRPPHLINNPDALISHYPWPGSAHPGNYDEDEIENVIRNYYAMITFIDDEVGRILDTLEAKGVLDETIIIFTADHGELLGDHNLLQKGPWPYECLLRIPMIISGPNIQMGKKTDAIIENVDLVPTLLEMLDLKIPYGVQGRSQLPVLKGQQARVRDSAVTAFMAPDIGFDLRLKSIHTDRYVLSVYGGEDYGELYDLQNDPEQLYNLYFDDDYAEIKTELYKQLTHRLILDEDPLPQRKSQW